MSHVNARFIKLILTC